MVAVVVNETLEGGWLQFLQHVKIRKGRLSDEAQALSRANALGQLGFVTPAVTYGWQVLMASVTAVDDQSITVLAPRNVGSAWHAYGAPEMGASGMDVGGKVKRKEVRLLRTQHVSRTSHYGGTGLTMSFNTPLSSDSTFFLQWTPSGSTEPTAILAQNAVYADSLSLSARERKASNVSNASTASAKSVESSMSATPDVIKQQIWDAEVTASSKKKKVAPKFQPFKNFLHSLTFEDDDFEYMFASEKLHWEDHEKKAVRWGGHLVSIHGTDENVHIRKIARGGMVWTGAVRKPGQAHRGLHKNGPEHWTWSDGSPWDYENWGAGQPDDHASGGADGQDRAQFGWPHAGDVTWDDVGAKQIKLAAVYKRQRVDLKP